MNGPEDQRTRRRAIFVPKVTLHADIYERVKMLFARQTNGSGQGGRNGQWAVKTFYLKQLIK